MRLFISSDIEGSCGINTWEETYPTKGSAAYQYFQEQMTREVCAACNGALAAGFEDVLVKDAHDNARNILHHQLPKKTQLIRGWSGDLLGMMFGIQNDCHAVAFTGYHACAGSSGNPMSHSFSTGVYELLVNGVPASEFTVNSLIAGSFGLPVVFISGDKAVCEQAKAFIPGITAVPVFEGSGDASISIHPEEAAELIQAGMEKALRGNWQDCRVPMADEYETIVSLTTHQAATKAANYPGAIRKDNRTVCYVARDVLDIRRFLYFAL